MKIIYAFLLSLLLAASAAAQTHSATPNWGASPTPGIAGYYVYRAPCLGTITAGICSNQGSYAVVFTAPATTLTWVDTNVVAGAGYVYEVTAYCPASGCSATISGESSPSNQVAVTIPKDQPAAPGGLTVVVK